MTVGNSMIGVVLFVLGLAAPAGAAVVIDRSVDAIGSTNVFNAQNNSDRQNFLVQFTLPSATTLNGAAVYSSIISKGAPVFTNTPVKIRLRNNVGNAPDATNLFEINTVLSAIDTVGASTNPVIQRLAADFSPVNLAAGTYWFGMSGFGPDIGWNINFTEAPLAAMLYDNVVRSVTDQYNMPYQLYGTVSNGSVVPEPSAWVMLVMGFGMLGTAVRRQQRTQPASLPA